MSQQAMFEDTGSATSSRGSVAGAMPSDSRGGLMTAKCGQVPARVSRSRSRVVVSQLRMSGIYGLSSTGSSASAALQQSLASRLAQSLDCNGSMEYSLTWNEVAMPSREPICQLRASARPTSGSGFTGWATPRTITGGPESAQRKQELGRTESGGGDLQAQAQLAGWPTARAEDSESTGAHRGVPDTLTSAARLAGWDTPAVNDSKQGAESPSQDARDGLTGQARLAGWATPQVFDSNDIQRSPEALARAKGGRKIPGRKGGGCCNLREQVHEVQTSGLPPSSSPAATGKRGVLNPAFSRWLQGYPVEWCQAAIRASRKLTPRRKRG